MTETFRALGYDSYMNHNDYSELSEADIARAKNMTVEEVIDEGLRDVIDIGLNLGLSQEGIDDLLQDLLTRRRRSRFKIL